MYSGTVSGSQDWKKVEVEVDENDLASILAEAGVTTYSRADISTKYAFQLLTFEAEILLKTTMAQSFNVDIPSVKAELEEFKSRKHNVLEQLLADLAQDEG
jgi:CII-binding regulator of phage lambda lysogenization HflD